MSGIRGVTLHIEPDEDKATATLILAVNGIIQKRVGGQPLAAIPALAASLIAEGAQAYARNTPTWMNAKAGLAGFLGLFRG